MRHSGIFLSVLLIILFTSCQDRQATDDGSKKNEPLIVEPATVEPQKPKNAEPRKQVEPDPITEELNKCAESLSGEWLTEISAFSGIRIDGNRLQQLSEEAKIYIKAIITRTATEKIPDLSFLKSLEYLDVAGCGLKDISGIRGLTIKTLNLQENPLMSFDAISGCVELIDLDLSMIKTIKELPDLSQLKKLESIGLIESSIQTLDGVENIINLAELNILYCEKLLNIDALANSHIKTLIIDKKTYDRFGVWFDANLATLKERNPGFEILFKMPSGL